MQFEQKNSCQRIASQPAEKLRFPIEKDSYQAAASAVPQEIRIRARLQPCRKVRETTRLQPLRPYYNIRFPIEKDSYQATPSAVP
jgi:head-tail adaptor